MADPPPPPPHPTVQNYFNFTQFFRDIWQDCISPFLREILDPPLKSFEKYFNCLLVHTNSCSHPKHFVPLGFVVPWDGMGTHRARYIGLYFRLRLCLKDKCIPGINEQILRAVQLGIQFTEKTFTTLTDKIIFVDLRFVMSRKLWSLTTGVYQDCLLKSIWLH